MNGGPTSSDPLTAEAIFNAALELKVEARLTYLAKACDGHTSLRERVEALLRAHDAATRFLPESPTATSFGAPMTGRFVCDYELLEEIARGGMGIVFKARQGKLDRFVAVKMMLGGEFASQEQALRFRAEVEAAARLQHPNIVRIHETGEQDGQPYFSMDYVEGSNLTAIVRDKPLPAKRAAGYVKTIAEAIHYAHEQGVLHRDLKPSNVLIDSTDQPRVTDFGLAKLMQKESILTVTGDMMGSPNFMPPEQAGAKGIRAGRYSDVYSLGGILFYLVTGRPPFVAENIAETLRHVLDSEPVSPRLLNPSVPQDIATICLKCLEKEPSKRFQTAQELVDELRRFLSDEPIWARPVSRVETFWRWRRRRPLVASLGAATLLLLLAVAIGSPIAAVRINRERQRAVDAEQAQARLRRQAESNEEQAKNEAAKSRQVAQFLKDMLNGVGPSVALGRDTTMLREILDKTAQRVGQDLTNHPLIEAELRDTMGEVYQALGQYERAEAMYRQALAIRRQWLGSENANVAHSLNHLASVLRADFKPGGAEPFAREAVAIQRKLFGDNHPELADALEILAQVRQNRSNLADAEDLFREALEIRRKALDPDHRDVASSLVGLAGVLQRRRKLPEAEIKIREALVIQKKLLGDENPDVASSLYQLGTVLLAQEKLEEAETRHREALALRRKLFGSEHRVIVDSLTRLAEVLGRRDKFEEIHDLFRQELANAPNPYPYNYTDTAHPDPFHSILGVLLGRLEFPRAKRLVDELLTPEIERQPQSVGLLLARADYFARRSQWKQAVTDFGKVVRLDPTSTIAWYYLAPALIESGDLELYQRYRIEMSERFAGTGHGRIATACLLLPADGNVLEVAAKNAETESIVAVGHPFYPYIESARGLAELRQQRYASAKQWLDKCLAHGWSDANLVVPAHTLLSIVNHHLGRAEDARANLAKATTRAQSAWSRSTSGDLGSGWHDLIRVQIYLREAKSLIEGRSFQSQGRQQK